MLTLQLGKLRHREAGYLTTDTVQGCEAGILQPIHLLSKLILCNAPLACREADVIGDPEPPG